MEVFKSKGPRMIYLTRLRRRVQFDASGEFSTDDPVLIKALSNHRSVTARDDVSSDVIMHKEAPRSNPEVKDDPSTGETVVADAAQTRELHDRDSAENQGDLAAALANDEDEDDDEDDLIDPDDHSRPELNEIARKLEIDPNKYGNKKALATAINVARAS